MTKICIKCKDVKDTIDFYKKTALRSNDDGYDYYCKVCRNKSAYKSWANNKSKCAEEDCNKPSYSRSVCRVHYNKIMLNKWREDKKAKAKLQSYPPQGADNA